jgi:hypothetical protein
VKWVKLVLKFRNQTVFPSPLEVLIYISPLEISFLGKGLLVYGVVHLHLHLTDRYFAPEVYKLEICPLI